MNEVFPYFYRSILYFIVVWCLVVFRVFRSFVAVAVVVVVVVVAFPPFILSLG